jgi:hypothetical protein
MEYLPTTKLQTGKWYYCRARNFEYGRWNGKAFDYLRYKFGQRFPDIELHYDDDPHFGTVRPLREVDIAEVPETQRLRDG